MLDVCEQASDCVQNENDSWLLVQLAPLVQDSWLMICTFQRLVMTLDYRDCSSQRFHSWRSLINESLANLGGFGKVIQISSEGCCLTLYRVATFQQMFSAVGSYLVLRLSKKIQLRFNSIQNLTIQSAESLCSGPLDYWCGILAMYLIIFTWHSSARHEQPLASL